MSDTHVREDLQDFVARVAKGIADSFVTACEMNTRPLSTALEWSGPEAGRLVAAEGILSTVRNLVAGEVVGLEADPRYPMIVKMISIPAKDVGIPNPDGNYQQATLHGDYTYRIFGARGSVWFYDIEVYSGTVGDPATFKLFTSLKSKNYSVPLDSDVEIILSKTKHDGYWLELPDGIVTLFIRQIFQDWNGERPAMMAIERVDAVYPPPPLTLQSLESRVDAMNRYTQSSIAIMQHLANNHLVGGPNSAQYVPGPDGSFAAFQYVWGNYICGGDEAIIVEFKLPQTEYWNIALGNMQGDGAQAHLRHASINNHQGAPDVDGVFRAVMSHADPGVKNWLDVSGRPFGFFVVRFYLPDATPTVKMSVVPFKEVGAHLPKDTMRVSAAERQAIMRRRLQSVYSRMIVD